MSSDIFKNLAKETVEYFEYDLSNRDGFIRPGIVKKLDSLICKTRTYMNNIGDCTKSHSDVGSWRRGYNYDDQSIASLLEGIHFSESYKGAEKIASDYLDVHDTADIFARLYLTLFGYECIARFVKNGMKIEDSEIEYLAHLLKWT